MEVPTPRSHRCSAVYTAVLLAYVRRAAGRDGVRRLLAEVGDHDLEEVSSASRWISVERLAEFAAAAAGVLGDRASVGRGIATETLRWNGSMGEDKALRALGHPVEVIRRLVVHGDRMSTAYSVELVHGDDHEAAIEVRYESDATPLSLVCDGHLELYPRLVELLGGVAAATHPLCALRGDAVCRFDIRWDAGTEIYGRNDHIGLLERLHLAARQMAAADDDDALFELALGGARDLTFTGVDGLILVVDYGDGSAPRIRTKDFVDPASADRVVAQMLSEGPGGDYDPVLLRAPLDASRSTYGYLTACFPPGSYTTVQDERVFTAYASHVATAIEARYLHQLLSHQSLHDELTGLAKRALLQVRTEDALRSGRRTGASVGLLFIDLDRFKVVNDTFGHITGDDVLRAVAQRLGSAVRSSDTVARVGGDEFVVLLPEIHPGDELASVAEALRCSLRRPIILDGQSFEVSCTVGVTSSDDHPDGDWEALLRAADEAMYVGKARGRDAVVVG